MKSNCEAIKTIDYEVTNKDQLVFDLKIMDPFAQTT